MTDKQKTLSEKIKEILEQACPDKYDGYIELSIEDAHLAIMKEIEGIVPEGRTPHSSSYDIDDTELKKGWNACREEMFRRVRG